MGTRCLIDTITRQPYPYYVMLFNKIHVLVIEYRNETYNYNHIKVLTNYSCMIFQLEMSFINLLHP